VHVHDDPQWYEHEQPPFPIMRDEPEPTA
jgi:hypothetical protein